VTFIPHIGAGLPSCCHVSDILPSNSDLVSTPVCYKSRRLLSPDVQE
jgi:hypothetical protein